MQIDADLAQYLTDAEKDELARLYPILAAQSETWQEWLLRAFPHTAGWTFAPHHIEAWDWMDALQIGVKPQPLIACWARGGGKSSTEEHGVARVAEKLSRRYALILSSTQDKADDHVAAIASLLERRGMGRAVNKYGHSKGWRRQQLRTAGGFNVAGFGLDTGMRGAKLDEYRPDWIILDDVDEITDSLQTIEKKIEVITSSIFPAGSVDCAVSFFQNAIHRESIMTRLIDGRADFLRDRLPVVPVPAVRDLQYEERADKRFYITGGIPTWDGQNLETCEKQLNEWGESAFLREAQHEVYRASKNAYFNTTVLNRWLMEVREGLHTPLDYRVVPHDLDSLRELATDGSLRVWETPVKGRRYILTADPASGVNTDGLRDNCSTSVLDAETFAQVAHLWGQWEPHEYASIINDLADWYGDTLVGVLRMNHGGTVLSHLTQDYEWPLATKSRWNGLYVYNPDDVFEATRDKQKPILLPGWPEDVRTKPYMMDTLGEAIDKEWIIIRSEQSLMECLTYVKLPGNKSGADTGAHDDCVSDLAIGAVLLELMYERPATKRARYDDEWEQPQPTGSGVWQKRRG